MKNIKKLSFVFISVVISIFSSCNKFKNGDNFRKIIGKNLFSLPIVWQNNNGSLIIHASRFNCNGRGPYAKDYEISATFFNDDTVVHDSIVVAGSASIHGLPVYPGNSNYYDSIFTGTDTATAQACFGATPTFHMAGNWRFSSFSVSPMRIPNEIYLTAPCVCHHAGISLSSDLTVTWNADALDTLGVEIDLRYMGTLSHAHNSSLSSTNIDLNYNVTDNGTTTISKSDFASFPVGGIVALIIGRGNARFYTTSNNKVIELIGYSDARYTDVIVP